MQHEMESVGTEVLVFRLLNIGGFLTSPRAGKFAITAVIKILLNICLMSH